MELSVKTANFARRAAGEAPIRSLAHALPPAFEFRIRTLSLTKVRVMVMSRVRTS